VRQLGLYKTSSHYRGKDVRIKDFKLKILICFNSPIIKHQTLHIFPPFLYQIDQILWSWKPLGGGLQMFLELQKQRNNVWGCDLLWVIIKCLLTGLSTSILCRSLCYGNPIHTYMHACMHAVCMFPSSHIALGDSWCLSDMDNNMSLVLSIKKYGVVCTSPIDNKSVEWKQEFFIIVKLHFKSK